MKTKPFLKLTAVAVLLFGFLTACGGKDAKKETENNVNRGNKSIASMNDISANQLPKHGIYMKLPQAAKDVVATMDREELLTVQGLLKDYINQSGVVRDTSGKPNVQYDGAGELAAMVANANEILDAVNQRLKDLQEQPAGTGS